ncbi:hypothetical protein T439DRAFT_321507 [Meredithblackwellia eburnea MCA 4105]
MASQLMCQKCLKKQYELHPQKLRKCSNCQTLYCSTECQKLDWPAHRPNCAPPANWYDPYRLTKDKTSHFGKLELITWNSYDPDLKENVGWGGSPLQYCAELKAQFEGQFKSNQKKFFKQHPACFRWTCCGLMGDQTHGGCDHHGTGPDPCTCDFCRMGKPVPLGYRPSNSPGRTGLDLPAGPDPRSYHPGLAAINASARAMLSAFGGFEHDHDPV